MFFQGGRGRRSAIDEQNGLMRRMIARRVLTKRLKPPARCHPVQNEI